MVLNFLRPTPRRSQIEPPHVTYEHLQAFFCRRTWNGIIIFLSLSHFLTQIFFPNSILLANGVLFVRDSHQDGEDEEVSCQVC